MNADTLKVFWYLALCTLIVCPSPIYGADIGKLFRLGYLDAGTASSSEVLLEAFRQEFSKSGWIDGKSYRIEHRFAEGKNERLYKFAAELVNLPVEVILVSGGPAALAVKRATSTIPIVMTNVGDPVGEGMVSSLARPDGNITGLSALSTELNTKRLELLKDTMPTLNRVGVLWPQGTFVGQEIQIKELRAAAIELRVKLEAIETHPNAEGLDRAFTLAKQNQVEAIITTATRPFFAERKRIVDLAGRYRLPAVYFQKEFVDEGGLMSYGADFADLYRRAAVYTDKILKGMKPADLPVQQATRFHLVINLKTAKQIGLTIPPNVLARADRVIK